LIRAVLRPQDRAHARQTSAGRVRRHHEPGTGAKVLRTDLGLRLISDDTFAIVFDAFGTTLRIQKVGAFNPHPFTAVGWQIPDMDAAVNELSKRNIHFERFPGL